MMAGTAIVVNTINAAKAHIIRIYRYMYRRESSDEKRRGWTKKYTTKYANSL